MKISKIIFPLILFPLLFSSCAKMEDFSLSSTVFIEDPYYPGLPIYSEWGYNTFGAYIDRKPFVSTNDDLPTKIIVNHDTLNLTLRGRMGGQDVDLKFSIKGYSPATNYDLTELNEVTINLKEGGHFVSLKTGNETKVLKLIEGELKFNRVQRLLVDEEPMRVILSGYFNFKTFLNDEPVAISYGRFDLGIGYENFYNY
jgi:hypothetical protein